MLELRSRQNVVYRAGECESIIYDKIQPFPLPHKSRHVGALDPTESPVVQRINGSLWILAIVPMFPGIQRTVGALFPPRHCKVNDSVSYLNVY